jgi:hypothetical protein
MRKEIILFFVTGAIMANIYHEGTLIKKLMVYKNTIRWRNSVRGFNRLLHFKVQSRESKQIICSSDEYLKHADR